jgi:hypothetical protein
VLDATEVFVPPDSLALGANVHQCVFPGGELLAASTSRSWSGRSTPNPSSDTGSAITAPTRSSPAGRPAEAIALRDQASGGQPR